MSDGSGPVPGPSGAAPTGHLTSVVGGSHGMTVAYDHALALADAYEDAGGRLRGWAARTGGVLVDADLLESAPLSPVTFAEAEAAVLAAGAGPDGTLVAAVVWEADALSVRVAVRATRLTDELVAQVMDRLDHAVGYTIGYAVGATAPDLLLPAAAGGVLLYLLWSEVPDDSQAAVRLQTTEEAQRWLDNHPELVQHAVNGSGGLLEGLWDGLTPGLPGGPSGTSLMVPDAESAAGVLAGLYSDGHGLATPVRLSVPDPGAGSTALPADLPGLLQHLAAVNDLSSLEHPEHNGTVEIQTITGPGGDVRHVVYLPGTDDLTTTPWSQDADVRDAGTNLLLLSGQDNAYQEGILDAMRQAGIRPGEPVALVGHSQGGMEAVAILSHGSPYSVTTVVTAGAPTAQVPGFPPGSHVLSLEHQGDVVPLLDGADNPDSAEQVTVRFGDSGSGAGDSGHAISHYVAGAEAVQASHDPSVRDQLDSLAAQGFVGGPPDAVVTSQVFQITRVP